MNVNIEEIRAIVNERLKHTDHHAVDQEVLSLIVGEVVDHLNVKLERVLNLPKNIIEILDIKANHGCKYKGWKGVCNGNGTDIGEDMDRLVRKAHRLLETGTTIEIT